jgi:hypothetical protein
MLAISSVKVETFLHLATLTKGATMKKHLCKGHPPDLTGKTVVGEYQLTDADREKAEKFLDKMREKGRLKDDGKSFKDDVTFEEIEHEIHLFESGGLMAGDEGGDVVGNSFCQMCSCVPWIHLFMCPSFIAGLDCMTHPFTMCKWILVQ